MQKSIRTAHSIASEARAAVAEFHERVRQDEMALVVFFCSSHYDLPAIADEINRRFAGVPVIGCTTAGEIGPSGYRDFSLSGASFSATEFSAVSGLLSDLQNFEMQAGHDLAQNLIRQMESVNSESNDRNTFSLLLVDGLSVREEQVVRAVKGALGNVPLVGGSAGDDIEFSRTWVFCDGRFHGDAAVLALLSTEIPFYPFKTQHFVSDQERLVVTGADPDARLVREINGLPAAEEYARVIGTSVDGLGAMRFAAAPVVVVIDGTDYVRSIQKANPDGSLTFFCAIDEGLVFRVAHGLDLVEDLKQSVREIESRIGPIQTVCAFDCILRNLEILQRGQKRQVEQLFGEYDFFGFSTYGEQFGSVHVNQTLTGVAFGYRRQDG